jgi:hypothetical protein
MTGPHSFFRLSTSGTSHFGAPRGEYGSNWDWQRHKTTQHQRPYYRSILQLRTVSWLLLLLYVQMQLLLLCQLFFTAAVIVPKTLIVFCCCCWREPVVVSRHPTTKKTGRLVLSPHGLYRSSIIYIIVICWGYNRQITLQVLQPTTYCHNTGTISNIVSVIL